MLVKNTTATFIGAGHNPIVFIRPGLNEIIKADWDRVKDNAQLQIMIREGMLEVIAEETETATTSVSVLIDMTAREACQMASECFDVEMCEGWLAAETRETVIKALKKQIKELKKPVEYRAQMKAE